MFDAETIQAFTKGDCWFLALKVHRLTGWPMMALGDQANGAWLWGHIVIQVPDGRLLDVTGVHPREELLNHWNFPHLWEVPAMTMTQGFADDELEGLRYFTLDATPVARKLAALAQSS